MREWLKEKRLAAGLTMNQAGEKLDMTESYYFRIEKGERQKPMDLSLAKKISDVFGLSVEDIIKLEEKKEE